MTASAAHVINTAISRAIAPRKALTVSQWADAERVLSSKGSAEPGRWRTRRNPPLREPMDCLSNRSTTRDVVLKFPIQFGKTEVAVNWVGYIMDHHPGPVMVCLPGEVSMNKWIEQKLNPMLEETEAARRALTSVATRDGANRRAFKDFTGGQMHIEHAGSPGRLKSTTVRSLIVDELDDFASELRTGDDPVEMLEGRTSAFPTTGKRLFISTPQVEGVSRIDELWKKSDQRRLHVPCPYCGHKQHLEWAGLHWNPEATECWYACHECGSCIEEHHKTAMIAQGEWIPANPDSKLRGYHINCLYYQIGIGPRWLDLIEKWRNAQNDPAKLKTFINDRLAETWEDPAMRAVKHNVLADRAEPYKLRIVPHGVLAITAGVDTQDNRLAVHITGWGRGLTSWTLDYVELQGDPALDDVWVALTELLNKPLEHESGALMVVEASAIDAGGHRTEAVKHYGRQKMIRRPLVIFGAVPNNAPVLSKGKLVDVNWRNHLDKRGVTIYHVGTVSIKHLLYSRIGADADPKKLPGGNTAPKEITDRLVHISDELPREYFTGLVSESYNPSKNRFEKRTGTRNEPLDTWVYSYAAAHHPELRLHRLSKADWDAREVRLLAGATNAASDSRETSVSGQPAPRPQAAPQPGAPNPFASSGWISRR